MVSAVTGCVIVLEEFVPLPQSTVYVELTGNKLVPIFKRNTAPVPELMLLQIEYVVTPKYWTGLTVVGFVGSVTFLT